MSRACRRRTGCGNRAGCCQQTDLAYYMIVARKGSTRAAQALDLGVLSVISVGLAVFGGLPYYHPDSVTEAAHRVLETGGNPEFFHYPALVIYLNAGASVLASSLAHGRQSQIPGLVVTVLFSLLGVVNAYFLGRRLTGGRVFGLLSGTFLATSPLWVANSHFLTVDIPLATLCVAVALLTLTITGDGSVPNRGQLALLGAAVGLAASAKYNGALVIVAALAAVAMIRPANARRLLLDAGLISVVALGVFLVTNPFVVADFRHFAHDFVWELRHARGGHVGYSTAMGWWDFLRHALLYGYGVCGIALAGFGVFALFRRKSLSPANRLTLLAFPVLYYLVTGGTSLAFDRYMLPMLPFLAVLSALAVWYIMQVGHLKSLVRVLGILAAVVALGSNLAVSVRHDMVLGRRDTRQQLELILVGVNSSGRDLGVYTGLRPGGMPVRRLAAGRGQVSHTLNADISVDPSDVFFFDSFSHDRFIWSDSPNPLRQPYVNYEDVPVIQITPFMVDKAQVPFSPQSVYSPYPPDLRFRDRPGPFIEVYCKERDIAEQIAAGCRRYGVRFAATTGSHAYYLRMLSSRTAKPG
jgi:4-amino-4-deoxy-L-arabinose transferase-like glycosyltransferase